MDVVALGLAKADARRRYAPISGGLSTLTKPYVFAHRFGANTVPEASLEGARTATAQGVTALEFDTSAASDGSLPVMHDSTVDRTTSSTGNVADLSAGRTQQLVIDAATWFGGGWANCRVPDMADLCREFGNKVLLVPESKQAGSAKYMVAMLKKFGITPDHVIVQSGNTAELVVAKAAGYKTLLLSAAASVTPAAAAAGGYDFVGVDFSLTTAAVVAPYHAAGVQVAVYTVDRQADFATWQAAGVDAVFSNDPLYTTDVQLLRTTDPYSSQAYWPGHLIQPGRTNRGQWSGVNEWGFTDTGTGQTDSVIQGWAVPYLKSKVDTFQIDLSFAMDALASSDATRWMSWGLFNVDYNWTAASRTGLNGYNFQLRGDGLLRMYRVDGGVTTQIGATTNSAVPVLGAWNTYRISVTPTTLTVTRPDLGTNNAVTVTDSTYRSLWYPQAVRNGAAVRFRGVTLT